MDTWIALKDELHMSRETQYLYGETRNLNNLDWNL